MISSQLSLTDVPQERQSLPIDCGELPVVFSRKPAAVPVPVTAFVPTRVVVDGVMDLPRAEQWTNFFGDIVHANFDAAREPLLARPIDTAIAAGRICDGTLEATKGFTRLTIIIFALHFGNEFLDPVATATDISDIDMASEMESFRRSGEQAREGTPAWGLSHPLAGPPYFPVPACRLARP